jgi:hypothetical protein
VGGAIPQDARVVDSEQVTVMPLVGEEQPFRVGDGDHEYRPIDAALVPRVLHGAPHIMIESPLPGFMLRPPHYSDDFLLRDLKNLTRNGPEVGNHHPEVRQVVFDSFQQHPQLLQHYLRS